MGNLLTTEENQQEYDQHAGYVPQKLVRPEILSNAQKKIFVIGDGRLLSFDKATYAFEQIPVHLLISLLIFRFLQKSNSETTPE